MSQSDVAIVTGASGGIGRAIAEAMLESGHHVVSLDQRLPDWSHARLEPVQVDLFDPKATADAAKDMAARHAISHVVHNAGIIRPNPIEQVTVEDIAALSQLHLGAALTLVQAALRGMKQRHFGRIVLIASRAALGAATRTAYSATKSGMFGMARTWALETAAHGITVNLVAPGPTEDRHVPRNRSARQPEGGSTGPFDPGRAHRPAGRRRTGRDVFREPRCRFHHRPGALRLWRCEHRVDRSLAIS
jgi:NAD(P)-dependent dehydrogenase (short-subunit alcohol dehydrogenase family)